MGWFSTLMGKAGKNETPSERKDIPIKSKELDNNVPRLHYRGKPDQNGLYPSELIMLSVAEKYKITETVFPENLKNSFEITNPLKLLKNLQSKGYLGVGGAKDVLPNLKLPELKSIATALGVHVSGRKADIVAQLSTVEDEKLSQFVSERNWKLTDKGREALRINPYVKFFIEKHAYSLESVDVNIWTVNEDCVKNVKIPYRDIIFRQLNKQMNRASISIQKNPASGTADAYKYCECTRIMSLFVEEEGKYIDAADLYFQYLFRNINIKAGLQLLLEYKMFSGERKLQTQAINRYYDEIQLYPFQKTEVSQIIDRLNIPDNELRKMMMTSFERSGDSGIMSAKEATDFVILELSGDIDRSKDLADSLARRALKKTTKRLF